MKAVKAVHSTLSAFDLFPAQQFLRYKGESEYKTATGGFCSIVVIAIFVVLFINTGLAVISKANVIVSEDIQHQTDPASITLVTSPEGGFMFAISVFETGIADGTYTYFNVSLQQTTAKHIGTVNTFVNIPLEPCTDAHFNFTTEIFSQYKKYNVGSEAWRCPPIGTQLNLGGTLVSDVFQYFSILIKKCDSTVYSNCANDSVLLSKQATFGAFTAVISTIATQINPSYTHNYLDYYIQTRNNFPFTTTLGVRGVAEVEDYQIDTDTSLLPIQSKMVQTGSYIPNLFQRNTIPVVSNTFINMVFQKSPYSITYTRTFQKIDDFLSYVGGLIGLVFALIFIMNSYSESSFEISIGSRLFTINKQTPVDSSSYNFLTYLCFLVFKICRFFGCCTRFQMMDAYLHCREEVEKQIDILTILQRITTLERGMVNILGPSRFQMLHFREKPTLEDVKTLREKSLVYKKYRKKDDEVMFWKDPDSQPKMAEMVVFSEQSSYSSMKTRTYRSFKSKLASASKQLLGRQLTDGLLETEKKAIKGEKQNKTQNDRGEVDKKFIGDYYFLQQSNPHIKGANDGWGSVIKNNQKDQL